MGPRCTITAITPVVLAWQSPLGFRTFSRWKLDWWCNVCGQLSFISEIPRLQARATQGVKLKDKFKREFFIIWSLPRSLNSVVHIIFLLK